MQCNIILPNEEFHFISFLFSRRLASGLQRCRRQAILAMVFIWVIIPWNCQNKSLFLKTDAMKKLRTHLSFTQLRFHCSKNKGRTLHLTTAANSSGEAVVQYFSGQTDANPKACGSFVRMNDDNSKLAADCNQWGDKQWGYPFKGKRRNLFVARFHGKYRWFLKGSPRWECDDLINNDTEHFGLSTGDFWRVFVR